MVVQPLCQTETVVGSDVLRGNPARLAELGYGLVSPTLYQPNVAEFDVWNGILGVKVDRVAVLGDRLVSLAMRPSVYYRA